MSIAALLCGIPVLIFLVGPVSLLGVLGMVAILVANARMSSFTKKAEEMNLQAAGC